MHRPGGLDLQGLRIVALAAWDCPWHCLGKTPLKSPQPHLHPSSAQDLRAAAAEAAAGPEKHPAIVACKNSQLCAQHSSIASWPQAFFCFMYVCALATFTSTSTLRSQKPTQKCCHDSRKQCVTQPAASCIKAMRDSTLLARYAARCMVLSAVSIFFSFLPFLTGLPAGSISSASASKSFMPTPFGRSIICPFDPCCKPSVAAAASRPATAAAVGTTFESVVAAPGAATSD